MGGPPARFYRKALDASTTKAHGIGRGEIVRYHDHVAFELGDVVMLDPLQRTNQRAPHRLDVLAPIAKALVCHTRERCDQIFDGLEYRPFGVDLLVANPPLDPLDEARVVEEQRVRLEDAAELLAHLAADVTSHRLEIGPTCVDREPQTAELFIDLIDREAVHVVSLGLDAHRAADGDAGGSGEPLERDHLAHDSSSNLAAKSCVTCSIASASSGP